ncbi:hypothetical protein NEOKW01_1166 [Nematocida sp. AWRm80]|nr:hypothetical protein NEOKW01_1166 [Nematocida sp. AWRm80]
MKEIKLKNNNYLDNNDNYNATRKKQVSKESLHSDSAESIVSEEEAYWNEDNKLTPFNILANCAAKELKSIMRGKTSTKENNNYLDSNSSDFEDELNINFPLVVVGGKRVFKCIFTGCSKVFPSLSRMRRHYIIHTGVKPFKCLNSKCHKSFSRRDNMIQHYKGHCMHTKSTSRIH